MRRSLSRFRVRALACAIGLSLLWLGLLGAQIVAAGAPQPPRRADVAIVLGAAVQGARPSPVFTERIRHAVALYRAGAVDKLLFTGGRGPAARYAESVVARRWAVERGVPPADILIEARSRTTRGNLVEARRLMTRHKLRTALLVSDPLHIKRAQRMATDLGLDTRPAATPTSRYRSWRTRAGFLLREMYFYHHYLVFGR